MKKIKITTKKYHSIKKGKRPLHNNILQKTQAKLCYSMSPTPN